MGCCGDKRKLAAQTPSSESVRRAVEVNPNKLTKVTFSELQGSYLIRYRGTLPMLAVAASGNEYSFKPSDPIKPVHVEDVLPLLVSGDFTLRLINE